MATGGGGGYSKIGKTARLFVGTWLVLAGAAQGTGPTARQLLGSAGWGSCDNREGCPSGIALEFVITPNVSEDGVTEACEALVERVGASKLKGAGVWKGDWWSEEQTGHNQSKCSLSDWVVPRPANCTKENVMHWRSQDVYSSIKLLVQNMIDNATKSLEQGTAPVLLVRKSVLVLDPGFCWCESGSVSPQCVQAESGGCPVDTKCRRDEDCGEGERWRCEQARPDGPGKCVKAEPPTELWACNAADSSGRAKAIKVVATVEFQFQDESGQRQRLLGEWDEMIAGYQQEWDKNGFEGLPSVYEKAEVSKAVYVGDSYERKHWQECLREHGVNLLAQGLSVTGIPENLLWLLSGPWNSASNVPDDCKELYKAQMWGLQIGGSLIKGSAIVLVGTELMGLDFSEATELWLQLVVSDVVSSLLTLMLIAARPVSSSSSSSTIDDVNDDARGGGGGGGGADGEVTEAAAEAALLLAAGLRLVVSPLAVALVRTFGPPPPPPPPEGLEGFFDQLTGSGERRSSGVPSLQLAIQLPSVDLVDATIGVLEESSSAVHKTLLARLAVLGQSGAVPTGMNLVVQGVVRINDQGQPEYINWTHSTAHSAEADTEHSDTQTILIVSIAVAGLVAVVAVLVVGALAYLWKTSKKLEREAHADEVATPHEVTMGTNPVHQVGISTNPMHQVS